jgi:protein-L-isoaspartate(D-aspartate) O-methyltransferase
MVQENIARENMLKSQILTGHVLKPSVLDALTAIEREKFVPDILRGSAYNDDEIPLGNGRFLMEPLTFGRLLEHAHVKSHETVLDVGSAMGYSSAVLSKMAQKVVALEEDEKLSSEAKKLLFSYPNIESVHDPLQNGFSASGPYDLILIEGAIQFLPQALTDQLCEGGRLVAIEHDENAKIAVAGLGKLVEYKKLRGEMYKNVLEDASISLLPAFKKPQQFIL